MPRKIRRNTLMMPFKTRTLMYDVHDCTTSIDLLALQTICIGMPKFRNIKFIDKLTFNAAVGIINYNSQRSRGLI